MRFGSVDENSMLQFEGDSSQNDDELSTTDPSQCTFTLQGLCGPAIPRTQGYPIDGADRRSGDVVVY